MSWGISYDHFMRRKGTCQYWAALQIEGHLPVDRTSGDSYGWRHELRDNLRFPEIEKLTASG
jgi:hypothetical protein